ncbi:MAG TPA: hypothetical protein VEW47_11720 [Candidatus Dormibacteraeota bacterium]|nr:hypothetical protein [Candidatus Dormibacteraeota bacterium]
MIGALVSLGAVVLAYLLGRYGKMSEFKFGLLQQAASLYYRLTRSGAEYRRALAALRRVAPAPEEAGQDRFSYTRETKAQFEICLGDVAAVSDLMEQFFDEPSVSERWNEIAAAFEELWERGDLLTADEAWAGRIMDQWSALVHKAALECKRHPWEGAARLARQILRGEL